MEKLCFIDTQVQYLEEIESSLASLSQYNEEADYKALHDIQVS